MPPYQDVEWCRTPTRLRSVIWARNQIEHQHSGAEVHRACIRCFQPQIADTEILRMGNISAKTHINKRVGGGVLRLSALYLGKEKLINSGRTHKRNFKQSSRPAWQASDSGGRVVLQEGAVPTDHQALWTPTNKSLFILTSHQLNRFYTGFFHFRTEATDALTSSCQRQYYSPFHPFCSFLRYSGRSNNN